MNQGQGPSYGGYGYDGVDDAQRQTDAAKKPMRFFLKYVENQPAPSAEVIFVDELPFVYWEHQPMVNGQKWGNFFPCNQGVWPGDKTCVMCQNNIGRYYIGLYTIIDCSEFEYEGRIIKNRRRILAAKLESIKMLRQKASTYKGLIGKRFLVSRTSARAARIGNTFDFLREEQTERDPQTGNIRLVDRQYWWKDREGNQHPPTPFNYAEVYKAETNYNLARLIGLDLPHQAQQGDVFDRQIAQNQAQQQQSQGDTSSGQQQDHEGGQQGTSTGPVSYA